MPFLLSTYAKIISTTYRNTHTIKQTETDIRKKENFKVQKAMDTHIYTLNILNYFWGK